MACCLADVRVQDGGSSNHERRSAAAPVDAQADMSRPPMRAGNDRHRRGQRIRFALPEDSYLIDAMPAWKVGQRCVSEPEPELGLGVVVAVETGRVGVRFPATGEQRLYAAATPVLKRVQFRVGETVAARGGKPFVIADVVEEDGLLVYQGEGQRVREDALSDVAGVSAPTERLMSGQADPGEVFNLRRRALELQSRLRRSPVRGFLGGRLELIPHQFYILHEVASRQVPRVLLADEVGLGKTIEACLIVQRLLAVGRATRVLVLVPETLVHQWFVELLRRFNLWFSIYDEERCTAIASADPEANPFLDEQLILCSTAFLAASEERGAQAIAAGWDLVVVDEAHHLQWSPDGASAEYVLVEQLAQRSPGLLLLTATPTQLGLQGHFARLRLLDPDRYRDYDTFVAETERYAEVADVVTKILEERTLRPADRRALEQIFRADPEGLARHLDALDRGEPGAREGLIRTLLDQHGPGRVMFRNTRAAMTGFPRRQYCPEPLPGDADLRARIAREIEAEELGQESSLRYSFAGDPRIEWLAQFLRKHRGAKVLLICRGQRKVEAVKAALLERINVPAGVFHEGLPLVQRDRNAAWFAEPDGAQILLCSEIGSEGRNFQFAHHLVLLDLPLNPGLIEQRIGRLDRIGQTETIRVHVPFVTGGADAWIADWYHRGLDAFETPLHGGDHFREKFRERLLTLVAAMARSGEGREEDAEAVIEETRAVHRAFAEQMRKGRDRLLELSSFNREVAEATIAQVRAADADPALRELLADVFDHFGVQMKEHEGGDVFLDPSHAFIERYPSIPAEGMLATFDRRRAIAREDIGFISADHPVVRDSFDLLLNAPTGTTAFSRLEADEPNLLLELIFVLEAVADARWHVDRFLAPTPIRVVVDARGDDVTADYPAARLAADCEDGDVHRFLEAGAFDAAAMKSLVEAGTERAEATSAAVRREARSQAERALGMELQRLIDLRRVNDHIRPEEIELTREQLARTLAAIDEARLRLDAVRLIVVGGE